ncbi:uncharacterized protein TEOVI_000134000 [Trypanosoma equiperdum]|uniref:FYVE-type domain-containing protein n=4 Tax=Trypanozoon TaxID=39700 RepID=Q389L9_TRYB2|nr:hypothetical protein, conserved [Trypanosoma brucei gambiense DAL972]XP_823329.1 hypothetical protein, conserved [Trypanosoma brucei brucei TREU927]RHW69905.1 hypothetical protein DPX39_100118500 [Trypanosoma brucei equiperdum]SCU69771.1 hypothetical protein, conserved [Trypanosoma equiperdum]EAN78501.1 hypothetical protein, conserved [Trypanosoma brucei brucei TREU927]CBH16256.1 hypothetical protein, conserved [Trypanosoma brucei gambiense DAL972]|eukprot:XP_011778520.1 hypothetical protein, conserved [Trypanosoma brucei gambiense DAL972]
MGTIFSNVRTHEEVPPEVKDKVEPITYVPAPESARPRDGRFCSSCEEPFCFYFTPSTNCDWCGRQFCTHCCPERYLLRGNPCCPDCTKRAYTIKRSQLLKEHLSMMSSTRSAEVHVAN